MEWPVLLAEVSFEFSRGSGPGGQHRNKTNSRATLRWNPEKSRALSANELRRIHEKLGARITYEGEIIISSDENREQSANREECLSKLKSMLIAALKVAKKRIPTKPTRGSKERRILGKKTRSKVKAARRFRDTSGD